MFAKVTCLKSDSSAISLRGALPGEHASKNDIVNLKVTARDSKHSKQIMLKKKLAEGGEGSVFTTSLSGYVAKIYKRDKLTTDRREKLTTMISKQISYEGICFPEALILNEQNEFVGYLMKTAEGFELGKSLFQPKLLQQKFPRWTKRDTIDISISILKRIKYLNDRNVILGDINPANILVTPSKKVFFVDCDSYQIEGYPCPVGTANFTPPEAQGKDYKTFLRTQEMENFAIATLMFMIMLPGKPPYSAVGGASPEHNIKEGVFPYPHKETETDRTPPGKWGYIWSHMSYQMRLNFYENFKKGERHFAPSNRFSANQWLEEFKHYRYAIDKMVQNDPLAIELFPNREKMKKCKSCGKMYVPDRNNYTPFCPSCDAKHGKSRSATCLNGSSRLYRTIPTQQSRMKLCPYCNSEYIPAHWKYCDSCKTKTIKRRECVNCHREFPVTVSLAVWEKEHGATRKQCDVCKAAGCTADPCRHALQAAPTASPSTSKIKNDNSKVATTSGSSKQQNSVNNNKQGEHGIGCWTTFAAVLAALFVIALCVGMIDGQFDFFNFKMAVCGIVATGILYWFNK